MRHLALLVLLFLLPTGLPAQNGWTWLFDGVSLDGWRQLNGTANYAVVDGTIVGTTAKDSPNSFLCSERFFGDFELEFDVMLIDSKLNSGVQIRSWSMPSYKDGRVHGYQVEISTDRAAGFIYDEARRGWLSTDRDDPLAQAAFKSGEWNHYRVVCVGPTIMTWVNGVPVARVHDDWSPAGFIGLQVHAVAGDPKWRVAWKNIRVREIGDGGGWADLFDGNSLDGWRVNENPGSIAARDGTIVVQGDRAHLFYDGPVYQHSFQNFELRALVMTQRKANSGIYFHTAFQDEGWPTKGYEVQVNNSQADWRRTGSLYAVEDVKEAPAADDKWFVVHVKVEGRHVTVRVDGKTTVDYIEPDGAAREKGFENRLLDRGTIALQAHDSGSEVRYKQIRVKPLPETFTSAAK